MPGHPAPIVTFLLLWGPYSYTNLLFTTGNLDSHTGQLASVPSLQASLNKSRFLLRSKIPTLIPCCLHLPLFQWRLHLSFSTTPITCFLQTVHLYYYNVASSFPAMQNLGFRGHKALPYAVSGNLRPYHDPISVTFSFYYGLKCPLDFWLFFLHSKHKWLKDVTSDPNWILEYMKILIKRYLQHNKSSSSESPFDLLQMPGWQFLITIAKAHKCLLYSSSVSHI